MQNSNNLSASVTKAIIWCVSLFFIVIGITWAVFNAFEDTDRSKNYVCQMPLTGEYKVWTNGGLQKQWWGNVYEYNKTYQINFTDGTDTIGKQENKTAMRKDANLYCRQWQLVHPKRRSLPMCIGRHF